MYLLQFVYIYLYVLIYFFFRDFFIFIKKIVITPLSHIYVNMGLV